MKTSTAAMALGGVAIVAFALGHHIGVRSMVREWQTGIAPSFAAYLAAKDTVEGIIDNGDED